MLFLRVTVFAKWPRHVRVRPEYVRIHEISLDGDLHRDQELQSRKHPLLANADSSSSNHCVVRNARGLPVDLRAVRVHRGLLRHRRKVVPMIKFGCDRGAASKLPCAVVCGPTLHGRDGTSGRSRDASSPNTRTFPSGSPPEGPA